MNKGFIKKLVSVVSAVSIVMGIVGCSLSKPDDYVFEPRLDTEAKVILNVSGFFGNFEALDQVIADFNNIYPNVEFYYEQNNINDYAAYLEANPNIDIMMTSQECFESVGDSLISICADLSEEDINLSGINPDMLSRNYIDGKLCAIPMGQKITGLIVNETLLESEGLSIPTNYSEFLEVLSVLKSKGYTPIQGPNDKMFAELTLNMVFDMILDDENLYEALEPENTDSASALDVVYGRIDDLVSNGYIDMSVNENYPYDNYDQAILNFFEGNVPFWVCDSEKVSGMKKRETKSEAFSSNPFEYSFIYAPLGDNGSYAYTEPWFSFAVNKNAANYDYSVEFIRFMATRDEINKMGTVKGIPSVAVDGTELDIYSSVINPTNTELNYVNDGRITWAMTDSWMISVRDYTRGTLESRQAAIDQFVRNAVWG